MKTRFTYSQEREPHFERRKKILAQHPEVRNLFKKDNTLLLKLTLAVLLQLVVAVWISNQPWWWILLASLTVGSTLAHVLFLGIHELSHDLAFKKTAFNNLLAIFSNFPIVVPYAMAFKMYHLEHHWNQGVEGVDTDIPTESEALLFKGAFGKFIWLINQILFYAIRPLCVKPMKPTRWQVYNVIGQFAFVGLFIAFFGWIPIVYLLLSVFLSGGLHPISGHFISEHYVSEEGQETYSYYGFWNKITFNVGYHNEHHDFPNIPGKHLPELHTLANDQYRSLKSYQSWSKVMAMFLRSESMNLFSRIKRPQTYTVPVRKGD